MNKKLIGLALVAILAQASVTANREEYVSNGNGCCPQVRSCCPAPARRCCPTRVRKCCPTRCCPKRNCCPQRRVCRPRRRCCSPCATSCDNGGRRGGRYVVMNEAKAEANPTTSEQPASEAVVEEVEMEATPA